MSCWKGFQARTSFSVTVLIIGSLGLTAQSQQTPAGSVGKPGNIPAPRTQLPPVRLLVPGTGTAVSEVGDDFEDPDWAYRFNLPKIYNDGETTLNRNLPAGISENQRWYEGPKRGQPDIIERVPTPPGGLPGSEGALLLKSLQTGGSRPTYQQQQDDFVCNVTGIIGKIPVSQAPSVVTRVWLPPIEQWERRTGCHFAFRASIETETTVTQAGFRGLGSKVNKIDESWPGMFLNMEIKNANLAPGPENPLRLYFWMKADQRGYSLPGPDVTQTGWWTLGMSFSDDGQVHYFARPGVEDLTTEDHIVSSYPYGQKTTRFRNFFFNVCNGDNGRTWSTPFIIDDPTLYVVKPLKK
jgi:hypothetical protein